MEPLPDLQSQPDNRRLAIDRVGVKGIRYPIVVKDRSRGLQRTVASINMYVNLPHHFKGTHMSRFLEVLAEHDEAISVDSLPDLLEKVRERLTAEEAHIELEFPYFLRKSAPVSGAAALMDYQVRFIGTLGNQGYQMILEVLVPVTTLCPCSREISERGAHNQRSHVTVRLRFNRFVWVEEIIEQVEANASCQLYPVLKRPDEKYVTERAYDNPRFVEDMVRSVAADLENDTRISWFSVAAENFESIHNHSAYAFIDSGREPKSS
ncbi:MAG: GTP cyclohydrolase I FolE2 [Magnetococcales bacterium]|nr:GTP cyclohydrolase I FolE2 [Magnetococcales bacterium]NGZ04805.1 GTP cyclohydrolase I FolE2 [Magnetococcales bacterium]